MGRVGPYLDVGPRVERGPDNVAADGPAPAAARRPLNALLTAFRLLHPLLELLGHGASQMYVFASYER